MYGFDGPGPDALEGWQLDEVVPELGTSLLEFDRSEGPLPVCETIKSQAHDASVEK